MAARLAPSLPRRLIGWTVGAVFGLAALTQAVFAAGAQAGEPWSAHGPANMAQAASRLLFYSTKPGLDPIKEELARKALERRPLTPAAVTFLAVNNTEGRSRDLFSVAARLGWQDQAAQRALYNDASSRGYFGLAMDRAEALLRQDMSKQQLSSAFGEAVRDPGYRSHFVTMLGVRETWADRYLLAYGSGLPDDVLVELFAARSSKGSRDRLIGTVAARLLEERRLSAFAGLRSLAMQDESAIPAWRDSDIPREFGWQLGNGYAADGDTDALRRTSVPGERPAFLLTALPPGRYELIVPGGEAGTLARWRWGIACIGDPARADTRFPSRTDFTVPSGCPVQTLSIAAPASEAKGDTLPPLGIRKVGVR